MIDPEDEAFNDIERMSRIRKESVRSSMLKPKTAEEFYSELLNKAREEVRKEPPKYSFKAHWEKDGRIGLVAAIVRSDGGVHILEDVIDMPQRTWVGLTNDELTDLFYNTNLGQASAVAQAIALLKEKNT